MISLDAIYLSPAKAFSELARRQGLRARVEDWLAKQGVPVPVFSPIPQAAILPRHVATWMYSDAVFDVVARDVGFNPVWASYNADLYTSENPYKRALVRRTIVTGQGRSGGFKTRAHKLVNDLGTIEKKSLSGIVLPDGQQLVDFHQALQPASCLRIDASGWLKAAGGSARIYYPRVLAQYICHGVCFDNFHESGKGHNEADVFTQMFLGAWQSVVNEFGLRPLIVQMPWHERALYYPEAGADWRECNAIEPEFIARINAGV